MPPLVPSPSDGSAVVTSITPKPSLMYQLVSYLLVFPVFRGLLRGRTSGNDLVPLQGPLVVVANHGSHLDPSDLTYRKLDADGGIDTIMVLNPLLRFVYCE